MKAMKINEIKERCEKGDKAKFEGIVDKVWGYNEKATKWAIGYQNVIIKDDTGKIKFVHTIKKSKEEELYTSGIEGKEVKVDGTVSPYQGKSGKIENDIFGELIFKDGSGGLKSPVGIKSGVSQKQPTAELSIAGGITEEEVKLKCLSLAMALLKEENPSTKDIIEVAKRFEEYVIEDKKTTKDKVQQKAKVENQKPKEENVNGNNISPDHIKQINILMALVENRGNEGKEAINKIIKREGYKSVKDFDSKDIKEATEELEQMGSEDIPF